jgi:predicted TIM-barrel fold metal-dependent hydrolase
LRLDAHHSFNERYPLDHLGTILARNRFEGSMLIGPLIDTPDFVRGIVVTDWEDLEVCLCHPKFRGLLMKDAPLDFEALEIRGIPVDIAGRLADVPRIAAAHSRLTLVIDHLGAPAGPNWRSEIEAAAQHLNVCCKLSGLTMFQPSPRPFVEHALALFGPDRLMFGSDWPHGLPEYTWKQTLAAFTQAIGARTIEVREQLLGGTAARVYGV